MNHHTIKRSPEMSDGQIRETAETAEGLTSEELESGLGVCEPWEPWETQLVGWSLGIGFACLLVLGTLINILILE